MIPTLSMSSLQTCASSPTLVSLAVEGGYGRCRRELHFWHVVTLAICTMVAVLQHTLKVQQLAHEVEIR